MRLGSGLRVAEEEEEEEEEEEVVLGNIGGPFEAWGVVVKCLFMK